MQYLSPGMQLGQIWQPAHGFLILFTIEAGVPNCLPVALVQNNDIMSGQPYEYFAVGVTRAVE